MLKTHQNFAENILRFYVDDEIISFLSSQKSLKSIYDEMKQADKLAAVYPLVIPKGDNDFLFDLMVIIKHEKTTEQGLWELFVAENFVIEKINLAKLFSYIESTTKSDAKQILQGIQNELKAYREQFNLNGKTFLEIDGENKIVAFGVVAK